VRPEDETPREPDVPDPPEDDEQPSVGDPAGEHEPPPATWAGRRRTDESKAEGGEPEPVADEGPEPPADEEEELRPGFTDEFDAIERELDEELRSLEGDDDAETDGEPETDGERAEATDAEADGTDAEEAPAGRDTIETETLALADREQAEDAALAGLQARTAKHEAALTPPPVPPGEAATPDQPPAEEAARPTLVNDGSEPPRAGRLWARFLAASLVIVVSMAAATSIALLNELTDFAKGLGDNDALASLRDQLEEVDGGAPQTILIIGSDKRLDAQGDPGRSDTTILLRVDPDKDAIALLSIPRDLQVTIPGVGVDKFNAAYSAGGSDKTLEVVKRVTGLEINHVVNINFTGFADAVDAIGCVYVDVDRRYYIPPESGISEIDIEAGYQRLCGYKALQYVRFRHDDNDLVRSARQQDFLREARQKLTVGKLVGDAEDLLGIFTEYTTSDISDGVTLLELLKSFLKVQAAPVNEVHFPAELGDGTSGYVTASDEAIAQAVEEFLGTGGTPGARPGGESDAPGEQQPRAEQRGGDGKPSGGDGDEKPEQDFVGPEMQDSTGEGRTYAHQFSVKKTKGGDSMIRFSILYPTRLVPGSFIANDSRAFVIDAGDREKQYGYKFVVAVPGTEFGNGLLTEYYGISGTDWLEAPILDNPSETRTIDGRDYMLFYDGDRLRLVGFKTNKAAYWVNNTLSQSLDEGQMLSIATSMREFEG
jgi:polyisoprenyl-teichoic acid--peptidoglycan teichoic acid transferase